MLLASAVNAPAAAATSMPTDMMLWLRSEDATDTAGTLTAWADHSAEGTAVSIGVAPAVVDAQLNGYQIVRFTGTEYMTANSLSAVFSGTNLPFSIFVLCKVSSLAADRTPFSAGRSTGDTSYASVRARTSVDTWGISRRGDDSVLVQDSGTTDSVDTSTWTIGAFVFNGSTATTYVSGRYMGAAATLTAGAMTIDRVTIGARRGSVASEFFHGDIAEVILYDYALTAAQRGAVEQYMATKYALEDQPAYYVSTATGDDSVSGMDVASPLATVAEAYGRLGSPGGTIYLEAAEATPIRETFDLNVGRPITFDASGADWYWYGTTKYTAGWNSEGGNVWSQTIASDPVAAIFVTTIVDGSFYACLWNVGASTTPAAGEYGYSGGKVYLRMPSDQDPNDHDLEVSSELAPIRVSNDRSKPLTVKNGVIRGGRTGGLVGSRTGLGGVTIAENVTVQYANNGFAIQPEGARSAMLCRNCASQKNSNDGWNIHNNDLEASYMRLENCTGSYNVDEGASPHDATIMEIYGGTFEYNGSAGVTAIESATLRIDGGTFSNNSVTIGPSLTEGGIYFSDDASGYVRNATVQDNDGPGLYVEDGNVTVTNLTSSGNTYADTY